MTISVLHVYKTYYPDPPGGLQEAIRQIALATKNFGIESKIFSLSPIPDPIEIERAEGRVFRSKSWVAPASCDLGGISAFTQFSKLAKSADIIHYHFPWPFADLMHLITQPTAPSVMTYHSDIVRQRLLGLVYAPLQRRMLHSMKALVATSPSYVKSSPVLATPNIAGRVRVIPLAIDEFSYPAIGDDSVFDRIHIRYGEPFFLFVGVLRYYKGLRSLIRAALTTRAKIIIAGSGPECDELQRLKLELKLENVILTGRISNAEKISLLKHCRALILPSHLRSEAYGMVLVEAAMFGKAMISCEIGTGTSFVNLNNETGLVVEPGNPEALAEAMNNLTEDMALAECYGRAARLRYEQLFSSEALGRAYSSLYHEVCAKR